MNTAFARQSIQLGLIWTFIAMVPVGRAYLNSAPPDARFYIAILLFGILIIPLLVLWVKFLQRKKMGWAFIIFIQLFISIAAGLLFHYSAGEGSTKMKKRTGPAEFHQFTTANKISFVLFSGNSYTIFTSLMMLSGLALLIEYNEQLRQKKNKEGELKLTLLQTKIKMLQSELQPHFIFNTLHSASSMMEFDVNKAQQLIEEFSILLRNYLDIINRQYYSLQEEVDFLQEYIKVQQLRYNGPIITSLKIPEACLPVEVPVILLQPIIENSIKHGWPDRKKTLEILISAEILKNSLRIIIRDNGIKTAVSHRAGIGIRNLKERLHALYADKFSFSENQDEGYCTEITIPLKHEPDQNHTA